jgi:hypothetical protein
MNDQFEPMPPQQIGSTHNMTLQGHIIKEVLPDLHYSSTGLRSVHGYSYNTQNMEQGNACDDCGLLFDSIHAVTCGKPVETGFKKTDKVTNGQMRAKLSPISNERWYKTVIKRMAMKDSNTCGKSRCEHEYNQLYNQYTANGETDHDVQEMTDERMATYNCRKFGDLYGT